MKTALVLFVAFSALPLRADWPHWRGPNRNSTVSDTVARLPEVERWRFQCGEGGSTPIIVDGQVFVMGWAGGKETLQALNAADGKESWKQNYEAPRWGRHAKGDQGLYGGVTASPSFDRGTGYLFTLGADGELRAWDTRKGGAKVWELNLYDRFDPGQRPKPTRTGHRDYGYTTSPLVHGEWIIVEVGSPREGNLIAFYTSTGKVAWKSENKSRAGHTGGPVRVQVDQVPCVAVLSLDGLHVARLDRGQEGKTVATFEWKTDYANTIASPAVHGSSVLITSAYNQKAMVRVDLSLRGGAKEVWRQRIASNICTPIIHEGYVYWVSKQRACLDFKTGEKMWTAGSYGDAGSMLLAGDRLVGFANKGTVFIAQPDPRNGAKVLAEKSGYFKTDVWPHLVLNDGHLYLKDRKGLLRCFDLSAEGAPIPPPPAPVHQVPLASIPGKTIVDLSKGTAARKALVIRDTASWSKSGFMKLDQGAFVLKGYDRALLEACRASHQLTIETLLVTDALNQKGPARIISFSEDPYTRNFTLGQDGDQLSLRLRTSGSDKNGLKNEAKLGRLTPKKIQHVLVSFRPGQLVAYIEGEQVFSSDRIAGDLSTWTPMHFLIGDEWSEPRPWRGHVLNVKIESGFVGRDEAMERFHNRRNGL